MKAGFDDTLCASRRFMFYVLYPTVFFTWEIVSPSRLVL